MATTPDLQEPQIAAARAQAWHQAGEALLTLEAARAFLDEHGFVLFAPRPLGAPAPSLVEATLGSAKPTITPTDAETARTLVARLVAEGFAVPLNLLGGPGDLPDFVVSTAAFPFVFTLRGDKGWKRPPETSGAVKVTPLALRVYELISERGASSVAEIVAEAGREVTESAVSRALNELWSLLRVVPALQQGEGETLWELTTARFVKAVKAGANAGQPTALSALISLYLGQALIATEEEIASFLSPLTARSRVRDVLHGLVAGRHLNEGVLEGKSVLYIPDALPDFAQFAKPEEPAEEAADQDSSAGEATGEEAAGGERIRRFEAGAGAARERNLRGKPVTREGGARSSAKRPPSGDRPSRSAGSDRPARSFGARSGPGGETRSARPPRAEGQGGDRPERRPRTERPDRTDRPSRPERPSFTRPWDEERRNRPAREGRSDAPRGEGRPPRRDDARGEKPAFRRDRPAGARPPFRRDASGEERRPFNRNAAGGAERRPFKRDGAGPEKRPFRREEGPGGSEKRPYRPAGGGDRPFTRRPRQDEGDRPATRSRALPPGLHESGHADRGERRAPRQDRGDRPSGGFRPREDRGDRPRSDRGPSPRGNFGRDRQRETGGTDRPRGPRAGGEAGRPGGPARGFARGGPSRSGPRAGAGEGRDFGPRGPRAGGGRPQGRPGDRGGAPRAPGGPARGPKRSPAKGASRPRPASRPKPEDEA